MVGMVFQKPNPFLMSSTTTSRPGLEPSRLKNGLVELV